VDLASPTAVTTIADYDFLTGVNSGCDLSVHIHLLRERGVATAWNDLLPAVLGVLVSSSVRRL